jgi:hypothetical protein
MHVLQPEQNNALTTSAQPMATKLEGDGRRGRPFVHRSSDMITIKFECSTSIETALILVFMMTL